MFEPNQKKRILVVDDHSDIREMMKFAIQDLGYDVMEASGPYEAIDKAEAYRPDLILMDIGMPLMDGLSATNMIKQNASLKETPIVVVTAYRDIKNQAVKAGCADVLYKPIDFEDLKRIIDRQIGASQTVS